MMTWVGFIFNLLIYSLWTVQRSEMSEFMVLCTRTGTNPEEHFVDFVFYFLQHGTSAKSLSIQSAAPLLWAAEKWDLGLQQGSVQFVQNVATFVKQLVCQP